MDFLWLAALLFKLSMLGLFGFFMYLLFILVIIPFKKRSYYSQFDNMCMNSDFSPPTFDLKVLEKLHQENKYKWAIYLDYADKGKDIHITQFGYKTIFDLLSSKAFDDFDKQIPAKIDKFTDLQELSFAKTFFGAVMHLPTNKDWQRRKTAFTKAIGLNFSSRYINLMIEKSKILMDTWKDGDHFDFIPQVYKLTLNVISCILMGKDFNEKMPLIKYTHLDGREETMDFYTIFPRLGKDLMAAMQIPYNLLFPTLIRNNIFHVNQVNYKNIQAYRDAVKQFLKTTTDEESCYKQIMKEHPDYDFEEMFNDLQGFLFDGYETISDTFCTTLYFLKQNEEAEKKTRDELKKLGFTSDNKLVESITYERLNELEYLMMVLKESLRIDPPLARSMHFYAKEDIKI
jgi:cytochrome P450